VVTLAAVTVNVYTNNAKLHASNCEVVVLSQFILSYLALAASSLLVCLRIIAIWNRDRVMMTIATGLWVTNVSFLIQGVYRFRAKWIPSQETCVMIHMESIKISTIVALGTDTGLILVMLLGLFHLRRRGGGTMALGHLLWNQGIIWLLLAAVVGVAPTVFICLHLNDPLSFMFQMPWLVAMSIAATRMYRSLPDFFCSDVLHSNPHSNGRNIPVDKAVPAVPISFLDMRVSVHTTREQCLTPQTNGCGPYISMGGKPRGLVIDPKNDIESGSDM